MRSAETLCSSISCSSSAASILTVQA
jgi:hypothetical protein